METTSMPSVEVQGQLADQNNDNSFPPTGSHEALKNLRNEDRLPPLGREDEIHAGRQNAHRLPFSRSSRRASQPFRR
uniref:Uncharacterized protein n=1 Tax=Mycena chlorophos TaxID=658473 RepID=A0ABQ0LXK7_MYCCL|nr:predicted protein [Mycena chlorophos]